MTASAPAGDDAGHAAALAGLGASPTTTRRFLDGFSPHGALAALAHGAHPADPGERYRGAAAAARPAEMAEACRGAGVDVVVVGSARYPRALAADRDPPAVLFVRGDLEVLNGRPRVAVVGTRAASLRGRDIAGQIGAGLAASGVVVVSGLARGIDCAAHAGAIGVPDGAPVVAVIGTHHDAPVTPRQAELHRAVARRGAILSELPPGSRGARWWFAVRNRVMAALAHVVVVVECHARGGSLYTVAAARARGVVVAAVPGSARTACAAGTNGLIADGAAPVAGAGDVVDLLRRLPGCPPVLGSPPPRLSGDDASACHGLDGDATAVWRVLGSDPLLLEAIVRRSGVSPGSACAALEHLSARGLARDDAGWWWRA